MTFNQLEIRYQTARSLPAPYAFFYTLTMRPVSGRALGVTLDIVYPDRDDIDDDELLAEGFTRHDDFKWSGQLPATWLEAVDALAAKTQLTAIPEDDLGEGDDFWDIKLERPDGTVTQGFPAQHFPDNWQYLVQELMQAALETEGHERPFDLTYRQLTPTPVEVYLTASFASRTVTLRKRTDGRETTQTKPWKTLKEVMQTVYDYDYDPDKARTKPPKTGGPWLSLDGDLWYDISGFEELVSFLNKL